MLIDITLRCGRVCCVHEVFGASAEQSREACGVRYLLDGDSETRGSTGIVLFAVTGSEIMAAISLKLAVVTVVQPPLLCQATQERIAGHQLKGGGKNRGGREKGRCRKGGTYSVGRISSLTRCTCTHLFYLQGAR